MGGKWGRKLLCTNMDSYVFKSEKCFASDPSGIGISKRTELVSTFSLSFQIQGF